MASKSKFTRIKMNWAINVKKSLLQSYYDDQMRKGFVARIFHLPEELDEKLRIKAVKDSYRHR